MHDASVVRTDDARLAARQAAHAGAEGQDALDVLFEAIAEADPRRIVELGPGECEAAEARATHGWILFPNAEAAQAYLDSFVLLEGVRVPPVSGPIRACQLPTVVVAEK